MILFPTQFYMMPSSGYYRYKKLKYKYKYKYTYRYKYKYRYCAAAMFSFHSVQKYGLNKTCLFFNTEFQEPKFSGGFIVTQIIQH
jgi:hypothetical protein